MHIPDAVLSPSVAATTSLVGAAGLSACLWKVRGQLGERTPVLMGTMAAFVFAAQSDQLALPGLRGVKAAPAVAGVVGTLAVFEAAWGLAGAFSRRSAGTASLSVNEAAGS